MGTNFYLLTNHCKHCERSDKVHIGKLSAGYRFALRIMRDTPWNSYGEFEELLYKGDTIIVNEYNGEIPPLALLKVIEERKENLGGEYGGLPTKRHDMVDICTFEFS